MRAFGRQAATQQAGLVGKPEKEAAAPLPILRSVTLAHAGAHLNVRNKKNHRLEIGPRVREGDGKKKRAFGSDLSFHFRFWACRLRRLACRVFAARLPQACLPTQVGRRLFFIVEPLPPCPELYVSCVERMT
jgi:hypothetical protein